ncbi:MAG: hypothetical protein ACI9ES_001386, partial [Oceanospirillaceae bacterium]
DNIQFFNAMVSGIKETRAINTPIKPYLDGNDHFLYCFKLGNTVNPFIFC